jgi:hypothetical protein
MAQARTDVAPNVDQDSLSSDGAPAIALAAIASINVVLKSLTDIAKWSPTGFSPVELAAARNTTLDLLDSLAELRSDADKFLRATVTYAIDSRLLPQHQFATTIASRSAAPSSADWTSLACQ